MQINQLFDDDAAVSPVIGVILMVAITVILAAVIGAFVIGIGDDQSVVPQASWDTSQDQTAEAAEAGPSDERVTITIAHNGGDSIDADNLEVTVNGDSIGDGDASDWDNSESDSFSDTVRAGDSATAVSDEMDGSDPSADDLEGDTVRLVWTSDDGGDSSVLTTYEVN